MTKGFERGKHTLSIMPVFIRREEIIIKGSTAGRTLNVQAEIPLRPALINFAGDKMIAISKDRRNMKNISFFFCILCSFYLTKVIF